MGRKIFRQIYWIPVALFILGLLSIVMLIWIDRISQRQRRDIEVCDALTNIQLSIVSAHLWSEEFIAGDIPLDLERISGKIDLGIRLAEAVLNGGESEHGQPVEPLTDSKLRKGAEDIHSLLTQFKSLALHRVQNPKAAPKGSAVYERFHAVSIRIQEKAGAMEYALRKEQIEIQAKARRLFWSVIVAWTSIVVIATIALWTREVRRRHAEEALEKAKGQLEIKVAERTKELRNVNEQLRLELDERRKAEDQLDP